MKTSSFCRVIVLTVLLLEGVLWAQSMTNSRLLHAVVSEPVGICYVDVSQCADLMERICKEIPEIPQLSDGILNKDFFNAVRCLGAQAILSFQDFSDFEKDQFGVAVQIDERIPLNTLWKGFGPLLKDELPKELSMPSNDENIVLLGYDGPRGMIEQNLANGQGTAQELLKSFPDQALFYCAVKLKSLAPKFADVVAEADEDSLLARIAAQLVDAVIFDASFVGLNEKNRELKFVGNLIFRHAKSAKEFQRTALEVKELLMKQVIEEMTDDEFSSQFARNLLDNMHIKCTGKVCRIEISGIRGEIIILSGIVLPSLAQARNKARTIQCMSAIKQNLLALMLYAEDNDGLLPSADTWREKLSPYGAIESCPFDGAIYLYTPNENCNLNSIINPSRAILLVCLNEHKAGKVIVGFADGHVESIDAAKVRKALECRRQNGELPKIQ